MSLPIGWYVRVTTGVMVDGVYNAVLYVAGFPTPAEAEAAVREIHVGPAERYEVLDSEIVPHKGPQPSSGEVRLLKGAV